VVLYTFTGGDDGASPNPGVIVDPEGNLYGTTYGGGATGLGVVYRLDAAGSFSLLHTFTASDGAQPQAGVTRDSAGELFGTAGGGPANQGLVYRLDPGGRETVLYAFEGETDGGSPSGSLTLDTAGNLYGVTTGGGLGARPSNIGVGHGVVYKLDMAGTETVLYTFTGGSDGSDPEAGVVRDSVGHLYGTTPFGGLAGAGVVCQIATQ
jgi:uncharacterized repeat protein (TIGR03803 family)